jgi:hypothetical protein
MRRGKDVERLCSSFGVAFRYIGSHAPRENNRSMVSRDWAEQHIHECVVGSPCSFCSALNLGLRAISLISARLDFPLMISPLALPCGP